MEMRLGIIGIGSPEVCPICEYSQMGLEADRKCPECGFAIMTGAPYLFVRLNVGAIIAAIAGAMLLTVIIVRYLASSLVLHFASLAAIVVVMMFLSFWPLRRRVWAVSWEGVVYIQGRRIRRLTPWNDVDTSTFAQLPEPTSWRDGTVVRSRRRGEVSSYGEWKRALGTLIEWGLAKAEQQPFPGRLCSGCLRPLVNSDARCGLCDSEYEKERAAP